MRIALVHLCSYGDCLYATLVARQIKQDFPGCHLTWVIGDRYVSVLQGNPSVDAIHTIPVTGVADAISTGWHAARQWVDERLMSRDFDRAFYTQIIPDNRGHCDGSVRSTIYRSYGRPIAGPHRPIVVLEDVERQRVAEFAAANGLQNFKHVFLFEAHPRSGQSPMTPDRAEALAHRFATTYADVAICISSDRPVAHSTPQVVDASSLSFRENAALSHFCTGLIGCSSGITWLTTSIAGELLPMLQVLSNSTMPFQFPSVSLDFQRFGLDARHVIELGDPDDDQIAACLETWITRSHSAARDRFDRGFQLRAAHAAGVYCYVRDACGRWTAAKALIRFIMLNGVSTIPWQLIPNAARMTLRQGLMSLGLLPLAKWLKTRFGRGIGVN